MSCPNNCQALFLSDCTYFLSADVSDLLVYSTTVPRHVDRTAPRPTSGASVISTNLSGGDLEWKERQEHV